MVKNKQTNSFLVLVLSVFICIYMGSVLSSNGKSAKSNDSKRSTAVNYEYRLDILFPDDDKPITILIPKERPFVKDYDGYLKFGTDTRSDFAKLAFLESGLGLYVNVESIKLLNSNQAACSCTISYKSIERWKVVQRNGRLQRLPIFIIRDFMGIMDVRLGRWHEVPNVEIKDGAIKVKLTKVKKK